MKTLIVLLAIWAQATAAAPYTVPDSGREAYTHPMAGLDDAQMEAFYRGRALFNQSWVIAPAREAHVAGLGPLYNRLGCVSCHPRDGRGAPPEGPDERMQSMLVRLSIPGTDAHGGPKPHPAYGTQLNEEGIPGVPGEGRAVLSWTASRLTLPDGSRIAMRRPDISFRYPGYGPMGTILFSPRVGQQLYGLGLLDAVPDSTLEQLAAAHKPDGVRGRVNRVWDQEGQRMAVGRFGYKANVPNLRDQIAGAANGDLGITSPIFPQENCMLVQTACRNAPSGGHPELTENALDDMAFYVSHLAVPVRRNVVAPEVRRGEALFSKLGCALCHVPTLATGNSKYPELAHRTLHPYTDLLVHDMGAGLSDGRPDYRAGPREWRTAPLWGIGLAAKVSGHANYLHDGRARTLIEAVLWHGGEAKISRKRFAVLSADDRKALIDYLDSL